MNPLVQVLAIIENNMPVKMTVDDIARKVHLSASHLQRLFRLTTKQSLMDYVRGRKLAHSVVDLLTTDYRIIDIAITHGFRHEQSYIRAFYKEFNCTPGEARKEQRILKVRERIAPEHIRTVSQGQLYGPEMVVSPAIQLIGNPHSLNDRYDSDERKLLPNKLAMQFYYEESGVIPNVAQQDIYYGYVNKRLTNQQTVEYMPSLQVNNLTHIPDGFKGVIFPSHLCARFRYIGEHHFHDVSMITAAETYYEMGCYFNTQTRYKCEPYFLERMDRRMYDGVFCRMEWLYPITDTVK